MMTAEKASKEALTLGYIAPPAKPVRSVTKGRFNFPAKPPSELYQVDKLWEKTANPIAYQEQKRRELWDRRMLEKKRSQKILKDRLMEEQMIHS